jgi:hypothetical protein
VRSTVCKSPFCGFATQKVFHKKPTYKLRLNSALGKKLRYVKVLSNKYKMDIYIFSFLLFSASIWLVYARSPSSIGRLETSSFESTCVNEGVGKYGGVRSYIVSGGQQYLINKKFNSIGECTKLQQSISGKRISASYLKGNNLLIDFYVNESPYYESSTIVLLLKMLFIVLILWALIRTPIKWILNKYA